MTTEYTVRELADKLNISTSAVYKWLKNGLKYAIKYKIGQRPFKIINIDDLNDFIKNKGVKK